MPFTKFNDSNNEINSFLHKIIFGENSNFVNDNIFKSDKIHISGSTALHIYNKFILKNNIDVKINDIDIYCRYSSKQNSIKKLLFKLLALGYQSNSHKNNGHITYEMLIRSLDYKSNDLRYEYLQKYFSLSKYISNVITLKNPLTEISIDIIIINCTIQKLLTETFDFDIVKNYYSNNILRICNPHSIINKTANMTLCHLKNRIFYNIIELYNFIYRYTKYSDRGYKIYIDGNEIPKGFVLKLEMFLNIVYGLCLETKKQAYLSNINYNKFDCGKHLMDFYYRTFYLNEKLMQKVYHPNNVFNISNEYLLDNE